MFALSFKKKTLRHEGQQKCSVCLPFPRNFSQSDELYVYIVMPTVTMKCLAADVHLSNLQNGSINEPNGIWAIPHLSETARGDCFSNFPHRNARTFMAVLHSEETIRTNCSRVQQSRPDAIVYEPNHLWVPYARTKHRLSQGNTQPLKTWRHKHAFSSVDISILVSYVQSNH